MLGALKRMMTRGKKAPHRPEAGPPGTEPSGSVPGLSRDANGQLKPSAQEDKSAMAGQNNGSGAHASGSAQPGGAGTQNGGGTANSTASQQASAPSSPPDTSALNQQVVQSAEFANFENVEYAPTMVSTPPEMMVGQTTGLAVQDAASYMNAIMQIAVAAQAVAIKKAAEHPPLAGEEVPLLTDIQQMVTQAVTVYGTVSTTAGTSAKTVISDFKAGS